MEDPIEGRGGQRDWGGDTGALGGYGSAGLFSRRRQMERTTGGSFLNLAESPRAGATGGYVRMPGVGPAPVIRDVEFGKSMAPSGPTAMASGVAPNFYGPGPREQVPTGRTARSMTTLAGLIPLLKRDKQEAEPEAPVEVPRPQLALPSAGRPMGTGEEGPLALGPAPTPYGALPRGGRAKRRTQLAVVEQPTGPTWDPTLVAPIRMAGIGALAELPSAVEGPRPVSTPPAGAIFATSRRRGRSTVGTESEPREMPETFEYPYAQPPIKNRKRKNRPGPGQFSLGLD
jgi:hypothetical protein